MFCFCYTSSQIMIDVFSLFLFSIYTWWWITGIAMLAHLWAQTVTHTNVISISGYKSLMADSIFLGDRKVLSSQTSLSPHQPSTILLISLALSLKLEAWAFHLWNSFSKTFRPWSTVIAGERVIQLNWARLCPGGIQRQQSDGEYIPRAQMSAWKGQIWKSLELFHKQHGG